MIRCSKSGKSSCAEQLSSTEGRWWGGECGQKLEIHGLTRAGTHCLKLDLARLENMNERLPCLRALGGEERRPGLVLAGSLGSGKLGSSPSPAL